MRSGVTLLGFGFGLLLTKEPCLQAMYIQVPRTPPSRFSLCPTHLHSKRSLPRNFHWGRHLRCLCVLKTFRFWRINSQFYEHILWLLQNWPQINFGNKLLMGRCSPWNDHKNMFTFDSYTIGMHHLWTTWAVLFVYYHTKTRRNITSPFCSIQKLWFIIWCLESTRHEMAS